MLFTPFLINDQATGSKEDIRVARVKRCAANAGKCCGNGDPCSAVPIQNLWPGQFWLQGGTSHPVPAMRQIGQHERRTGAGIGDNVGLDFEHLAQ